MSFRSTRVGPFQDNRFDVHGELTIRDVTRPVVFQVVDKGELPPVDGNRRRAFGATLALSREEFNLKFPAIQELFGLLVGDRVEALLDIHLVED
jgi:polyisoprenoid-binding protein YceI